MNKCPASQARVWIVLLSGLTTAWAEDDKLAGKAAPPAATVKSDEVTVETDFLRLVESEKGMGRLETAIVTYEGKGGVTVDLIGVVHIADKSYYRDLDRRLVAYDKLLYEMVSPKGIDASEIKNTTGPISMFQRALKDALGLEFQLDAMDYTRKNFVHADLDPKTFSRLQSEKGESILGLLFKTALKAMELQAKGEIESASGLEILLALTSKDSQRRLKYIFARELEGMEKVLAGIEDGSKDGSVLVAERNKAALVVLEAQIKRGARKLGILYGAGHMVDFEKRLVDELGMKKTRSEWVTAWNLQEGDGSKKAIEKGKKAAAEPEAQPSR